MEGKITYVKIFFKRTKSQYFTYVLSICSVFKDFKQEGDEYTLIMTINEALSKVEVLSEIYNIAYKWKSFYIELGYPVEPDKFEGKNRVIHNLQNISACAKKRQDCVDGDGYCNGWGCRLLSETSVSEPEDYSSKPWYTLGHLENGYWRIDKSRIVKRLKHESLKKLLNACPYYNHHKVDYIVSMLPETIDVSHKNWRFIIGRYFEGDEVKEVVDGIMWVGEPIEFNLKP